MGSLIHTFEREYVFLGTTDERARVLASGRLYRQPKDHEQQTVEHGTVVNPESLSLTAVAFTGRKNISRNLANGLHSVDYFGPKIATPAPGYTIDEVQELVDLGLRWHNNTLRPACTHMADPEGETLREKLDAGVICSVTGQKWGGWYAEVLPDEVRARFIELMEKGEQEKEVVH